jgi:peptidoglycan/LPS O-acetylase OafA/YrhL
MKEKDRVFGLDVMRASAILLVVFSHYFASTPLGSGGFPGVEIFFVLSGFLIGNILVRSLQKDGVSGATLRSFWVKRWFRTLPNYVFFFFVNLIFVLLVAGSPGVSNWYLYPLFLQNFFYPMPGFYGETWSLAVEEWFYLLFPLLIVVLHRKVKFNKQIMLAAVAFFLITPLLLRVYASQFWDVQTMRRIVLVRLDTMMYGVLAALIMNWHASLWKRLTSVLLFAPALLLVGLGLFISYFDSRVACVFCFPLIAIGVAITLPFLQTLQRWGAVLSGVIEYISKVSYSTYLVHVPFFFFIERWVSWDHVPTAGKFAGRMAMLIAALLISYLPYKFVELPFMQMRRHFVKDSLGPRPN